MLKRWAPVCIRGTQPLPQLSTDSFALFCLGAFLSSLAAYWVMQSRWRGTKRSDEDSRSLVFLLKRGKIVDLNFAARQALASISGQMPDDSRLRFFLAQHFEDFEGILDAANCDTGAVSRDRQLHARRQVIDGFLRLSIESAGEGGDDIHVRRAMEAELETLRANTAAAPFLLWRQNSADEVVWVNQAYMDTVSKTRGHPNHLGWPLPCLFPTLRFAGHSTKDPHRVVLHRDGGEDAWFDCHVTSIGSDILCTAIPADEAVRAENRRREFTQTLTKTFAELAIGLAIFDRSRRLVLFNPALMDLTSLPTDFLTSRPSLVGFLDHLRENRVMPEPRDYRAWRTSIAELEAAASNGTYRETWSLPDGQTYHVTGRPHPDGAVALLFEDISADMSLTRRFRAELEESQAVIDAIDDAVAVFSAAGQLSLTNRAYRELWDIDPDEELSSIDITGSTRRWHSLSAPTPVWGDFRDFGQMTADREEWSASVALVDGRAVHCRFIPQKAGASMVMFKVQATSQFPAAKLRTAS